MELLFVNTNARKLLDTLRIKYGCIELDGVEVRKAAFLYDQLNFTVGHLAVEEGLDLVLVGAPFLKKVGAEMVRSWGDLAQQVRDFVLPEGFSDFGMSFKLCANCGAHGSIEGPTGTVAVNFGSFKDLFEYCVGKDLDGNLAVGLLQQLLETDLPIEGGIVDDIEDLMQGAFGKLGIIISSMSSASAPKQPIAQA